MRHQSLILVSEHMFLEMNVKESKFELVTTIMMNLCVFVLDQSLCRPSRIQTAAQTWQTEVPCDATGSWRMYGKKAMVSCRWQ